MGAQLRLPHVAVVGGGCAGLAAAARLAEAGVAVTLFEASPALGGRARGVSWKRQMLDNGQHILLGAYRETLDLLRLAGVDIEHHLLRLPLQLNVAQRFRLSASTWLPAPLHIMGGLLSAQGLRWRERLAATRFMLWMRATGFRLSQDETVAALLQRKRQPDNIIRLLWEPLCLAALNTPIRQASAQVFLNVLRDSFARSKSDSDLLLPRSDLSSLLAQPLAAYIVAKQGQVHTGCSIEHVTCSSDGFQLTDQQGVMHDCSHLILAVSPFRLAALLQRLPGMQQIAAACGKMDYQPIYTLYLQYAEHVALDEIMTGMSGGHGQWLFDRGRLCKQPGQLAVVISAEGAHQNMTQAQLAGAVIEEVACLFPQLPQPLWHKVIAEKRATFACTVGAFRPSQITAIPGLYLAGDYTAGDYPATIEGAIRSGSYSAGHLINQLPS